MKRLVIGRQERTAAPILVALTVLAFVFFLSGSALADDLTAQASPGEQTVQPGMDRSEYEYEPGEGLHREEWYDPSDWFDREDDGISYETDWYDNTYGYGKYYDDNVFGYYEDDFYDFGYEEFDEYDYDYYTDDWYDGEGAF